jgi:hypothetical protein
MSAEYACYGMLGGLIALFFVFFFVVRVVAGPRRNLAKVGIVVGTPFSLQTTCASNVAELWVEDHIMHTGGGIAGERKWPDDLGYWIDLTVWIDGQVTVQQRMTVGKFGPGGGNVGPSKMRVMHPSEAAAKKLLTRLIARKGAPLHIQGTVTPMARTEIKMLELLAG